MMLLLNGESPAGEQFFISFLILMNFNALAGKLQFYFLKGFTLRVK